ncbi:hypothetical protein [Spiroplasma endosymbiont of 'Nebria riversi']|uniref:hypothetical protein n=1 Tax=Spiroplasma endosymbiont of 'Nebria riversi' TaxID=2792084 RepID=UPI001C047266|nr:hypothetical protein [Spiroplasma endosymbiont of 'Nebria riversi']
MKKLLGLLSAITMTSGGMAGVVANSPYEKQELENNKKISKFKRNINNLNLINSYFINKDNFNVRQINEITRSVNHIAIFSNTVGTTVANSLYFATNDGLYFMGADWRVQKINGINEAVIFVTIAPISGNAFAITKTGKSYFISNTPGDYGARKIIEISGFINSISVYQNDISDSVKANSLYFATDDGLYFMHDDNSWKPHKINGINEAVSSIIIEQKSGNAFAITKTGKSYFINKDNFNVRQINEITISVNHIAIFSNTVGTTIANSLYFATNDGLYFMGADWRVQKINGINEAVIFVTIAPISGNAFAITKTGKSYFISNTPGDYGARKIIEISGFINSISVYQNDISDSVETNSLYFATDDGLYFMYDDNLWKPHKINGINEAVSSIIIEQKSGNAFAITKTKMLLNIIIQINNLRFNNIINDEIILNELNYLNPDLDISQLEIINKTDTSATIKAKDNGKYFGEVTVNYKIKNKDEINAINLNELIKRAVFFKFRDESPNLKFKEIKYIDTNNLNFSNTEITKQENSFSWSNVPKNVCSDREIINKTPNKRSFNVPACEYNSKSKLVFQITTGLTKTKQENKLNGWNINSDDEMKLTDFTNINNKNSEIINVLSNEFDLSNKNKQEQEMILSIFKEPADKFELNPDEKLKITYPVRIIISKVILNLKQKITGNITAKIIDYNNKEQIVTLSITEVMQILQKYSLLPNEITLDKNNDKITFNGEAFFSSEREGAVRTNTITTIV